MHRKESLLKIIALLYTIITVLGTVTLIIFDRFRETPLLITFGKIGVFIFTILSVPLFLGIGGYCLWQAYRIVCKPMSGYQEEPGMLGDGAGSGPSRKLNKSHDIIADKIWNGGMYGFFGGMALFSGVMILRYLIEGFITVIRQSV